jgi:hypothetical protein
MITEERHHLLRIMVKDINRFIEFDYMDNGYLDEVYEEAVKEADRRLKAIDKIIGKILRKGYIEMDYDNYLMYKEENTR